MGSFSITYELQNGPEHIPVEEYAEWCIANFRELLSSDPYECEVQDFLEQHPWLVPGHSTPGSPSGHFPLHSSLIAQPKLPGQLTRFPDFMWIATHSGAWYPTLIEIERPSCNIYNKDGTPSQHFSKARNQLNQWRSWFNSEANVAQFKEMYGIPDFMLGRRMILHMILIYGRRSELDNSPELARQRGSLLSGDDEELVSFDRLLDHRHIDTTMKDAITIRATGNGRYRAKYVPPVLGLVPNLTQRLFVIDGLEEAIEANPRISKDRKAFLKQRIPYWKEWAKSSGGNMTRGGDRE